MEFAIAKVSTKGQIVIPRELRTDIKKGDEFLIIKDNGRIVIKNLKDIAPGIIDDLKFAERVEKAWKRYDKGGFKSLPADEFIKKLEKC